MHLEAHLCELQSDLRLVLAVLPRHLLDLIQLLSRGTQRTPLRQGGPRRSGARAMRAAAQAHPRHVLQHARGPQQ
jgi:hypothetical protein